MPTCHAIICMLEWFACVAGLIYGFIEREKYAWLGGLSVVMILIIPVINETLLCLKGACCKRRV